MIYLWHLLPQPGCSGLKKKALNSLTLFLFTDGSLGSLLWNPGWLVTALPNRLWWKYVCDFWGLVMKCCAASSMVSWNGCSLNTLSQDAAFQNLAVMLRGAQATGRGHVWCFGQPSQRSLALESSWPKYEVCKWRSLQMIPEASLGFGQPLKVFLPEAHCEARTLSSRDSHPCYVLTHRIHEHNKMAVVYAIIFGWLLCSDR